MCVSGGGHTTQVHYDCNTFKANITLKGHSGQIKPKAAPIFHDFGSPEEHIAGSKWGAN